MSDQPAGHPLTDQQRLDWLRLTRTEGVGPRTFRSLINRFGSASEALSALPSLLKSQGRIGRVTTLAEAEDEIARAARYGTRFVALGEPDYPRLLRLIESAPPLIGLRGQSHVFQRPAIAIVGSRNASGAGLKMAEQLAAGLGQAHCVVVSGLARGIDAYAHRASLHTGTVAVLAGGQDKIYPAEHSGLLEQILESGAAISELPMGWEPRGRDFPRRNRIISGLSHGVIVVEAANRSGSLITARFATEQGRDVFAVPGSPLDPRAEGTNELIREGATLIGSVEHVLQALAPVLGRDDWPPQAQEAGDRSDTEPLWDELDVDGTGFADHQGKLAGFGAVQPIVSAGGDERLDLPYAEPTPKHLLYTVLGPSPLTVDDLVRLSGLSAAILQTLLFELEMEGLIERHGGGLVSAAPSALKTP
jgi:DNA processing protein